MTLHSIFSKLRKQNKGQYLILGFCISLSVLLITSYALMYLGPTVQDFLPQGGDTRKLASLLLAVTAVGCTIFTLYASSLFFRYKSREYGILLALGSPKKALRPLLFSELAFVTGFSGADWPDPVCSGIVWNLEALRVLPSPHRGYGIPLRMDGIYGRNCILHCPDSAALSCGQTLFTQNRYHGYSTFRPEDRDGKGNPFLDQEAWHHPDGLRNRARTGCAVHLRQSVLFHIPSIFNLIYFVALAGIYLIILSCVSQNSAGKRKDKYYSNLVSISMMRFTAKVTTKNMCVIVLLLFCCLFAAFFGMLYSDTTGISMDGNEKAYSFHFPAEEEQITKNDIEKLPMSIDSPGILCGKRCRKSCDLLRYRDMIDDKYVTLDAKKAN